MKNKLLLSLLVVFIGQSTMSYAGKKSNDKIDSLRQILPKANDAKILFSIYSGLVSEFSDIHNKDSVARYKPLALQKLKELNPGDHELLSAKLALFSGLAIDCYLNKQFSEGIHYAMQHVQLATQSNDKEELKKAYFEAATIFNGQGLYRPSIEYMVKYAALVEDIVPVTDLNQRMDEYHNIGGIFSMNNDFQLADSFLKKSLFIAQKLRDNDFLITNLIDVSINFCKNGNDFNKALLFIDSAIHVCKNNDSNNLISAIDQRAFIYLKTKHYDKALIDYFELVRSGRIANPILEYGNIGTAFLEIAKSGGAYPDLSFIPVSQNARLKESVKYLQMASALNFNRNLFTSRRFGNKLFIFSGLAEAYELLHDHKNALSNYKRFIHERDSVYGEEKMNNVLRQKMEYDLQRQQDSFETENIKRDLIARSEISKDCAKCCFEWQRNADRYCGIISFFLSPEKKR